MAKAIITHIQLERSTSHRNVIVCGSPQRAEWFSKMLEDAKPLARNREYHSYLGKSAGQEILVVSHGVGAAGAAICFQELIDAGAEKIIRLGTAGALAGDIRIGNIILATSAVRMDGVSRLMIPVEFPAVPDLALSQKLATGLQSAEPKVRSGMVLTSDLFYPGKLNTDYAFYRDAGVLAVEMECSALFIIAALRNVKAASLLVIDGDAINHTADTYDPRPATLADSLEVCFHAAIKTLLS